MFINYAHRGASEYAPENTLAAFYLGLQMGANGIETDVRPTKDGVLVLFHDDTLLRITGEDIPISSLTYQELLERDLGSYIGKKYQNERIVLYTDFLKYFAGKPIQLAIEIKAAGVEREVRDYIYQFKAEKQVVVTSFMLDSLKLVREVDDAIPLGYLSRTFDQDAVLNMVEMGIGEICPKGSLVNKEMVGFSKQNGLGVRAWGIKDTSVMMQCLEAGVDGMTVNFPDKLAAEL